MSSSPKEKLPSNCPYKNRADCGDPVKNHCINGQYQHCHSYKFLQECEYVGELKEPPVYIDVLLDDKVKERIEKNGKEQRA